MVQQAQTRKAMATHAAKAPRHLGEQEQGQEREQEQEPQRQCSTTASTAVGMTTGTGTARYSAHAASRFLRARRMQSRFPPFDSSHPPRPFEICLAIFHQEGNIILLWSHPKLDFPLCEDHFEPLTRSES